MFALKERLVDYVSAGKGGFFFLFFFFWWIDSTLCDRQTKDE